MPVPTGTGAADVFFTGPWVVTARDVGSGSGRALNLMARAFPDSRFTG